jgi:ribonuclease-3
MLTKPTKPPKSVSARSAKDPWFSLAQEYAQALGFRKFKQPSLLALALTHGSYAHELQLSAEHSYERLEFLGDAVLKLVISRHLFNQFPNYDEGQLTQIRAIVVSDKTLAGVAAQIGLGDILRFGPAEAKQGGAKKPSNLACGFEALLGALYLDGQQKRLEPWLIDLLTPMIESVDSHDTKHNNKAALQEWSQAKGWGLPDYRVESESGPAHDRLFTVSVRLKGDELGRGHGKSKKEAQQAAAQTALDNLPGESA